MPLHSVRFDDETEQALEEVCEATGESVSVTLKKGVFALRDGLVPKPTRKPFHLYQTLDLGPGGYARAPARRAKQAMRELLRRKHRK